MTIYDTPGERFQAQFQVLMSEARLLVNEYEAAFTKKFPDEYVKGDSFPEATVVRLMLGTIPIFEAAVACLNEPGTSLGAYALMRTMIDTWSHLDFIQHGNSNSQDDDEMECRAIRIDLGMAELARDLVKDSTTDPKMTKSRQLKIAEESVASVEKLMKKHGCKGPRRSYKKIVSTVQEMAKRPELDWLWDAYSQSSMTVHGTGYYWTLEPRPDGRPMPGTIKPSHRAARLNHLVVLFSAMAQSALAVIGAAEFGAQMNEATQVLLGRTLIKRAMQGDYD